MLIEELLTLPPWIDYEGVNFELQLFNNGGNEIRLCYQISHVDNESPHKAQYDATGTWSNKFRNGEDPPSEGWLYLQEGIETDVDFLWSVRQCWYTLWEWGLMRSDETVIL